MRILGLFLSKANKGSKPPSFKRQVLQPVPRLSVGRPLRHTPINTRVNPGQGAGALLVVSLLCQPWPAADVFVMRFDGSAPLGIGTDRHQLDPTGRGVTVTDTGFGNVRNGLQFNDAAIATLGDRSVAISLAGAAAPVAAFRAWEVEAGA